MKKTLALATTFALASATPVLAQSLQQRIQDARLSAAHTTSIGVDGRSAVGTTPAPQTPTEAVTLPADIADLPEAGDDEVTLGGYVALTIDDGPFAHTPEFLELLAEHDVLATFFVIGEHVTALPEETAMIVAAGHELANHSYTHVNLTTLDFDAVMEELVLTQEAIYAITGEHTNLFRAPYLSVNDTVLEATAELGLSIFSADAIGQDWENISPEQIASNVLANISNGSIILLHEQWDLATDRTMLALPIIFAELAERGLTVVTLSELIALQGMSIEAGAVYSRIG